MQEFKNFDRSQPGLEGRGAIARSVAIIQKPKLSRYQVKRNFFRRAEPSGDQAPAPGTGLRFVVQKHAARRLHYDLRLEYDGGFQSWAVTRQPSRDPADKRLAVEVKDHPLESGDFEGTIPSGEYGGGTVQLWNRFYWLPENGNASKALEKGELKLKLAGTRLKGRWALICPTEIRPASAVCTPLARARKEASSSSQTLLYLVDKGVVQTRAVRYFGPGWRRRW